MRYAWYRVVIWLSCCVAGTHCELKDYCASMPCRNGATCVSLEDTYKCTCAAGFRGPTCNDDIQECLNNPCKHGKCRNTHGSYTWVFYTVFLVLVVRSCGSNYLTRSRLPALILPDNRDWTVYRKHSYSLPIQYIRMIFYDVLENLKINQFNILTNYIIMIAK